MPRLMAVLRTHIELFREVFELPGVLAEPFLMLGFQTVSGDDLPADFDYPDLKQVLEARGLRDITTLDYFDPRADLRYDLNLPIPEQEHERYQTVFDVGTLEHVFDTRQALENCLRAVMIGGHYFLHTPVKGYFSHGLHTFHPRVMIRALAMNGFEVVYRQFSSRRGEPLENPREADDALVWVVGKKTAALESFRIPQQDRWGETYARQQQPTRQRPTEDA
jgi:hypothetical protein